MWPWERSGAVHVVDSLFWQDPRGASLGPRMSSRAQGRADREAFDLPRANGCCGSGVTGRAANNELVTRPIVKHNSFFALPTPLPLFLGPLFRVVPWFFGFRGFETTRLNTVRVYWRALGRDPAGARWLGGRLMRPHRDVDLHWASQTPVSPVA
jgi:hypothetical protein